MRSRFIVPFLIAAALCSGPRVFADCSASPSVGVSVSPQPTGIPIVTMNYSFPDTTSSAQRALVLRVYSPDGGFGTAGSIQPQNASGTWVINHEMFCRASGTYRYEVTGTACNTHSNTSSATYQHNVKPTVSVTYEGPDGQGHGRMIANYEFPNTSDASQRSLVYRVWQGTGFGTAASHRPVERTGTWTVEYPMTCRTGTFDHEVTATTCSGENDKDRDTVTVHTKPTVSVSPGPIQDNGNVELTVNYGFPNTDHESNRTVAVRIQSGNGPNDFGTCATRRPVDQYGTLSVTCNVACDLRDLKAWVIATSCTGEKAEDRQPMPKPEKPKVSVALSKVKSSGLIEAKIDYHMGKGTGSWSVRLDELSWVDANGVTRPGRGLFTVVPSTRSGTITRTFSPPSGAQLVTVRATAASCSGRATDDASIECDPCDGSTKDPVFLTSGNVRVTDSDPLPPIAGHSLVRTYNSDEQIVALFGRGSTTLFDRRMIFNMDGAEQIVSIVTETNQAVVFRGAASQFRQTWPRARAASDTLTHDATAGTYAHRPAGSTELAVFRASDGRLIALRDLATGREAQLVYGANGLPQSVTDSWSGTSWNLTIDGNRRVSSIAVDGRSDRTWSYAYDSAGNLLSVTAPGNLTWRTYTYAANRMTASYDASGNLIESHTYDASGAGISSTGPSDEIATIQYELPGSIADERITRVTYKTGRVAEYAFRRAGSAWRTVRVTGGCSSCGASDATYVRDDQGRIVREQNADGYVTVTTYGTSGVQSEQRFLRPAGCDPAADPQQCRLEPDALAVAELQPTTATVTTTYSYDDPVWPDRTMSTGVASVMDPAREGRETVQLDPATGQTVSRVLRGWTGAPIREETRTTTTALYDGTEGAAFTVGGAFEAAWQSLPQPRLQKAVDGPRGDVADVTRFVYYPVDAAVPATWRGQLAAVRNGAGHVERYEDYDEFGNARRVIDENGVARQRTYDALGRLVTATVSAVPGCDTQADPLCGIDLTQTRSHAGAGAVAAEQNPGGGVVSYQYDSRGRVAAISRGSSLTDLRERTELQYDPLTGKKSQERSSSYQSGAWVERKRQSFVYDSAGRLTQVVHADGASQVFAHDAGGHVVSARDENHASPNTHYAYDPAGRLSEVRQTLASAPAGEIVTRYGYDIHGNLVSVTDPNGNTTTYSYDDFGQMLAQVSPVTGTTSHTYDIGGNLVAVTDANGATTTRTYDVLGRVLNSSAVRQGAEEETSFSYDTAPFGVGRVASMTDPTGSTAYSYDRRGLLIAEQKTIGSSSYSTKFAHDRDGNRSRVVYPSGRVVDTTYDHAGRPVSMAAGTQTIVASAEYLPFGPLTRITFGNGTTRTMTYDDRYRPLTNALAGPSGVIASYGYGHDPAGNVTRIDDAVDPAYNRSFGYDDLGRLVTANTGAALWGNGTYSYDPMGNLVTSALGSRSQSFSYAGTTPRLAQATENGVARGVAYDAAGNETTVGSQQFQYTPGNRLAAGESSTYVYDGRGIRTVAVHPAELASLTVAPSTVYTAQSAGGTVTLTQPAGAGGVAVALASSGAGLIVPATVQVPEGETQATFDVTLHASATAGVVTITATYRSTRTASVTVAAGPSLQAATVSPSPVKGGTNAVLTIDLAAPAPPGGATIALSSSSASVSVPATMAIAAGETSGTVIVSTVPVTSATTATITAAYGASTAPATLEVLPPSLTAVELTPATVMGGQAVQGVVTLDGPAPAGGVTVTLAMSNAAVAVAPSSVVVAEGQTGAGFVVTTAAQSSPVEVTVTATLAGVSRTASLTVTQCVPVVAPPPLLGSETVWVDDALPAGASLSGHIVWDASQHASGNASLVHVYGGSGPYSSSITTLNRDVHIGESAVVYFRVNECAVPREIKITWYATNGYWRSAYWGEPLLGGEGVSMGPVPVSGEWVRVEIPFSQLGMEERTVGTIALAHHSGQVWFDRIGTGGTACVEETEPEPLLTLGETVWVDDTLPAGVSLSGQAVWDTSQHASGTASLTHAYDGPGHRGSSINGLNQTVHIGEHGLVYFRVNECAVPREIKITWYATDGRWRSVYWGEQLLGGENISMGAVPVTGDWVQAEIPFADLWMETRTLGTVALEHHGGEVWFDRIGKSGTACFESTEPAPAIPAGETVWVDDALPAGASLSGHIRWDASQHASGTASLAHLYDGQGAYSSSITTLNRQVHVGESAVVYFRVNECAVPREIKITWYATNGYWKSAYWGEPLLGGEGISMGPVPVSGDWVRVEIPFSQLGMETKTIGTIALAHHSGQVWFDRIGTGGTACVEETEPAPPIPDGDTVWVDDALPAGVSLSGPVVWDSSQHASGTASLVHLYGGSGAYSSSITGLNQPMVAGESAVVYLRVNECVVPREIKITWYATDGYWKGVYWGESLLGGEGLSRGAVPTTGEWLRVEVPFDDLDMDGRTLGNVAIEHHSGQVWFDRIGKVSPVAPAVLTGFTASHASPQPAGTTITWTATATGSVMPLEYQFEREEHGLWWVAQPYGTANSYTWTPDAVEVGDHAVRVSVRNGGSLAAFDDTATLPMLITESGATLQGPPVNFLAALLSRARMKLQGGEDRAPVTMAVSTRLVGHSGSVAQSHYLYTPELNLMAEATAADGQTTIDYEYLWFGGQPVAQFETSTGAVHYYFNDHLGTPILTTDATGAVDWRVEREPYGRIVELRVGAGRHQPLSLPGQEQRTAEASYNIFRWYRAGWGRYTSVDRLGWDSVDGSPAVRGRWPDHLLNPAMGVAYSYALDSPLTRTDPRGESAAAALPIAAACALADGPFPFGDVVAVVILAGAAVQAIDDAQSKKCETCEKKKCRPCDPPVGTIGYQVHTGHTHHPYGDPHLKLWRVNQDPKTCKCFWNAYGYSNPPPPPGSVPYTGPHVGGGGYL